MKQMVYAISTGEAIKIGISANVEARVRQLQSANAEPLTLLWAFAPDELAASYWESEIHEKFHSDRMHGEWFRKSKELSEGITYHLKDFGQVTVDGKVRRTWRCKGLFIDKGLQQCRKRGPLVQYGRFGQYCWDHRDNEAEWEAWHQARRAR